MKNKFLMLTLWSSLLLPTASQAIGISGGFSGSFDDGGSLALACDFDEDTCLLPETDLSDNTIAGLTDTDRLEFVTQGVNRGRIDENGVWHVEGNIIHSASIANNIKTITALDYTFDYSDYVVIFNGISDGILRLPDPTNIPNGTTFIAKNTSARFLEVIPDNSITLDGRTLLNSNEVETYTYDKVANTWRTISAANDNVKDYYMACAGQSNMEGQAAIATDSPAPDSKVRVWNRIGNTWGEANLGFFPFNTLGNGRGNICYYMAHAVQKRLGDGARVNMVIDAQGGRPIDDWLLSGAATRWNGPTGIDTQLTNVLANDPNFAKLDAWFWMQGESDNNQTEAYYQLALQELIDQIEAAAWGGDNIAFVAGELLRGAISNFDQRNDVLGTMTLNSQPNFLKVKHRPWIASASSEGLTDLDGVHYDADSLLELGQRMADVYLALPHIAADQITQVVSTVVNSSQPGVQEYNNGGTTNTELKNLYSANGTLDENRVINNNALILQINDSGAEKETFVIRRTDNDIISGMSFKNSGNAYATSMFHESQNNTDTLIADALTIASVGNEIDVNNLGRTATFGNTGQIKLWEYGTGNFDDTVTRLLGVTATGEVVESPNVVIPNCTAAERLTGDGTNLVCAQEDLETVTELTVTSPTTFEYVKEDGNPVTVTLNTATLPVYAYKTIWAEEGGGGANANYQWSYGNGATGLIGIPVGDGWEITGMFFQADTFPANGQLSVNIVNMKNTPVVLGVIQLSSATDGGGQTNNASKYVELATPIVVPDDAVIGFQTNTEVGATGDMRVGVDLRKEVGQYINSITLN